jgi:DNA-binding NarL/FixJ family response regulator
MDASEAKRRILVVDDHPVVRRAIIGLLNNEGDLTCCGEVAKLPDIVPAVNLNQPDLVLLDLFLDTESTLPIIEPLRRQFPQTLILVLSQYDETIYAEQALEAGAAGYVLKEESPREVLAAIRAVFQEEIYLSHKLAGRLLYQFLGVKAAPSHPRGIQNLTYRELQVLYLISTGMSARKISEQLELSIKTVETYRDHLKHKLNLASTSELADYVMQRQQSSPIPK